MIEAQLNRVNVESKIMQNFTLVKFLLNFKHQIFAEISSGVMLFLRCKPHMYCYVIIATSHKCEAWAKHDQITWSDDVAPAAECTGHVGAIKVMRRSERSEPTPRPSARKKDIIEPAVSKFSSLTRLQKCICFMTIKIITSDLKQNTFVLFLRIKFQV